jgi:hypothetical protein
VITFELTGCEKEKTMKCKECGYETKPGEDVQTDNGEKMMVCPKCEMWRQIEEQPTILQSELNDVLCAFENLAKDLDEEADAHIFTAKNFETKAGKCRDASRMIRCKLNDLR